MCNTFNIFATRVDLDTSRVWSFAADAADAAAASSRSDLSSPSALSCSIFCRDEYYSASLLPRRRHHTRTLDVLSGDPRLGLQQTHPRHAACRYVRHAAARIKTKLEPGLIGWNDITYPVKDKYKLFDMSNRISVIWLLIILLPFNLNPKKQTDCIKRIKVD